MKHAASMKYGIKLANPKEYYNEAHRPTHFVDFAGTVEATTGGGGGGELEADRQDQFE